MATYYVDATGGNDGDTGLSPGNAWQTIGHVNAQAFSPGDSILFKRGETWIGTCLTIPSSGAADNHITFADYDTGALPIIDGNDAVNCIAMNGKSYLTFQNIEVTQGFDFGFHISGAAAHHIDLLDCVAHDCGNDNIIMITQAHDCRVIGCVSYDAYQRAAGPRISCLEIADEAHDIQVYHCEMYGSVQAGITIHSHAATEFPYNVEVQCCSSHDNDLFGIEISQDNAGATLPGDAQIHITQCYFNDNAGGGGTGGGSWIPVNGGDPYPNGIIFDMCTFISAHDRPAYVGGRSTYHRCIFRANYAVQVDTAQTTEFYNCVFYRASAAPFETINNPNGLVMRNCIFFSEGNAIIYIRAGTVGVDIDYCQYWSTTIDPYTVGILGWLGNWYTWANWLINSGQDANSPAPANPLFIDATNGNYSLERSSTAINTGTNVGLPYCGSVADVGRFEMQWPSQLSRSELRQVFVGI